MDRTPTDMLHVAHCDRLISNNTWLYSLGECSIREQQHYPSPVGHPPIYLSVQPLLLSELESS